MGLRDLPLVRQLTDDPRGLGTAARSRRSAALRPRTAGAERVVQSICPFCAVGCGQRIFVEGGEITQIEGDPDSPISRGRLCPKGSASRSLVQSPSRLYRVKYRRPHGTEWEALPLAQAMDMIADRLIAARDAGWEDTAKIGDGREVRVNRTLGVASLGGATLDNEENYLIKKFFSAMGAVQIENQARI
jgi:formate dehydrogenase major subunit